MENKQHRFNDRKDLLLDNLDLKEKRHDMESIAPGKDLLSGDIHLTLEQIRRCKGTFL